MCIQDGKAFPNAHISRVMNANFFPVEKSLKNTVPKSCFWIAPPKPKDENH